LKINIAYEITVTNFDDAVSSLALFGVIGLVIFFVAWKFKKLKHRIFLLLWGVCAGIGGFLLVSFKVVEHLHTYMQYSNGNYETFEGTVLVLRQQPQHGHAPGDLIEIDGHKFELDYFTSFPGYHVSIANKGVLREGVYARVLVHDRLLLKVEYR